MPLNGELVDEKDIITIKDVSDERKRLFLKVLASAGLGVVLLAIMPRKAEALVMGGTPSTSVVGLKNSSNVRIDPATESGLKVLKKTVALTSNGTILTAGAQKIRVYNMKFSLSADLTSVSFNFGSNGAFETYLAPKSGGLYGANNQPNFTEGAVGEDLKVAITGTATIQTNVDYILI